MSTKYGDLGEKIKKMRIIKKYSQEELGKVLDIPKQSVSRIEKGERKVTVDEFEAIAKFLGVPSFLLEKDGWIEKEYSLPYPIKNKWDIEVPEFIDDYIVELDGITNDLVAMGDKIRYKFVVEELRNTIKLFQLFLKEIKDKVK